ncbi:ArsA family ATPase [Stigmatella aurantiaca]|uniref:arsenite-transporting ATPase n=1 Tax=Stigmatella aurantiaca (strain DW4/3-1) TaxID=378806 RepID=Q091B7_STIAD|nr:ArsA family ATPase [Stigmatella aurantiaca]ADO72611.1 Arsenical pump-driving ATPase [Stigmatella aurantiaca DW4/3-1]EAU66335.1 anion-transporting ATPase [Stigmatella aurantiaca DW4/3-1]CAQ34923.1 TPA: putative anion-transporting ATPase [Stigmatella aurantiaca DW4/3-1]
MARIILVSGKGGAGKTAVAAATGLAASRRGVRTLVLSFDHSRSLSGAFDIEEPLFATQGGPVRVNDHLHLQEIDAQEELRHGWTGLHAYVAAVTGSGGLDAVAAVEVAITPGLEELVTLLRLGEHIREQQYELIVVDCPSTAGALRLVGSTAAMSWYFRRQLGQDHRKLQRARSSAADGGEAAAAREVRDKLVIVDALLHNPEVTTLRLVTTADKVAAQEAQRAYTYFSLYGIATDCLVINGLLPEQEGPLADQYLAQQLQVEKLQGLFAPLPVVKIPLHPGEVVGEGQLEAFGNLLYTGEDPARVMAVHPALGLTKDAVDVYRFEVKLPFVSKDEIELHRRGEELVIQVGAFRRNILLPKMIALLPTEGARMEGDRLIVSFRQERGG